MMIPRGKSCNGCPQKDKGNKCRLYPKEILVWNYGLKFYNKNKSCLKEN